MKGAEMHSAGGTDEVRRDRLRDDFTGDQTTLLRSAPFGAHDRLAHGYLPSLTQKGR
jgi:hypothetical protein